MPATRFVAVSLIVLLACSALSSRAVGAEPPRRAVTNVAVLIFDGVELLDFAGPAEVFIVAAQRQKFRVYTVAGNKRPIRTMGGIQVTPEFTYETAPPAHVVVVPGGNTSAAGDAGIQWIRQAAKQADVVMSVCFGAFLLAKAGLLDGVEATTHHWAFDDLKKAAPQCKVVRGRRFVDSGKIVTTGGVTAGIDGALHVVERLAGKAVARWTATEWMEHKTGK